jgi:hypothetical protein
VTSPFAITVASPSLRLGDDRTAQAAFTVSNTSLRAASGRARVVPEDPATAAWLSVEGAAERALGPDATEQYLVRITAPTSAAPGPFRFRLDVVDDENPDDSSAQGPTVVVDVPPASQPKRRAPWWVIAVAAVVLILVVLLLVRACGGDDEPAAADDTEPPGEPVELVATEVQLRKGQLLDLDTGTVNEGTVDLEFVGFPGFRASRGTGAPPPDPDVFAEGFSAITRRSGAVFSEPRRTPKGFDGCSALAIDRTSAEIGAGAVVCVITSDGRTSEVRVLQADRVDDDVPIARFAITTFEVPGT